jgi:hypothetical protein
LSAAQFSGEHFGNRAQPERAAATMSTSIDAASVLGFCIEATVV